MRRILQVVAVTIALASSSQAFGNGTPIPIPTVTIMQGDMIEDSQIVEQRVTASAKVLRNYYTSRETVVGKVARRVLPAGHAIPMNALREPYSFKEGERVGLTFSMGGLRIEAVGVALEPGVTGKVVSVRNVDTGVVVRGAVMANGSVQVGDN